MNYGMPIFDAASLDLAWTTMVYSLSRTCTVLVLYTIYVVLFLFSSYTLIRRNSSGRRFMLVTSLGMFLLATSGMLTTMLLTPIQLALIKAEIQHDAASTEYLTRVYSSLNAASDLRLVTNRLVNGVYNCLPADIIQSILTDSLFLYRCYMIWGSRKIVLILPGIFIVATCVMGYLSTVSYDFITNLPLWTPGSPMPSAVGTYPSVNFMNYSVSSGANMSTLYRRYHAVIAMILESGALYCLVLLLQLVAASLASQLDAVSVFQGMCKGLVEQMINIIPTLIFAPTGASTQTWGGGFPEDVGSEVEIKGTVA
ncbi:hypothetical protein C8R45DRAFT_1149196 [Mycena sanguinolenta]|nr:hypothetical protein C8R45DRAFT_1149196 [Mycena sanguinolenta]